MSSRLTQITPDVAPGRPTLAEEQSRRRGCRVGLAGLAVRVDNEKASSIRDSSWDKDSRLLVILENGEHIGSDRLTLIGRWPVYCCRPSKPTGPRK